MKKVIRRKKISVATKGYIAPLAIEGPVSIPNWVEMSTIERLITGGYKIYEHLKDGRKIELTAVNYDKELGDPKNPSMDIQYEASRPMGYHNDKKTITIDIEKKTVRDILRRSTVNVPQSNSQEITKEVPANKVSVQFSKKDKHNKHNDNKSNENKENAIREDEHIEMK